MNKVCRPILKKTNSRGQVWQSQDRISKEKDKQIQEEDDELARIEECDAMNQLSLEQKVLVNNAPPRRISFDFESTPKTEAFFNGDVHRKRSHRLESPIPDAETHPSSHAMSHDEDAIQASTEVPTPVGLFWTTFEHLSVDPESALTFYWKAAVTIAVLYNCILVISRMAFQELRDEPIFTVLDIVCDLIYVLDIIIEARTSFLCDGLVVTDCTETTQHYKQKSYFQSDLLAICPTQTLACIITAVFWPGIRINRLFKYHTMEEFFQKTESRTNKPNVLRAFKLGTHLSLVIHWFACLYYMLSEEYIFTGLTFLIGVFVFAAVVGNVGDVISNMNAARRDFQARTNCIDEPSVLQLLPDRLRTEVAIHVHLDILKKVCAVSELANGLVTQNVSGRDMYIISHGKVEILFPDADTGAMKQVSIMHPGSFFGEISLLKLDEGHNRRTADVRSLGFSELFCLSRRDLIVALSEYPEAKRILEDYGRERYNNTKRTTPIETDESRPSSPPSSANRREGSKKATFRSVFERVMKQEGFTKLLENASKGREISEIKAAIDEMRAQTKSGQFLVVRPFSVTYCRPIAVTLSFSFLSTKAEELEKVVVSKTAELQAAHAHIASLEKLLRVIMAQTHGNSVSTGSIEGSDRRERSNIGGLSLAPRWPDLVPTMSPPREINQGDRSLPKTALHARGCLKEVPTYFTESLSKQNLLAKCKGKPFGPLFVGSRRHLWNNSALNFQKNTNASLLRTESSPSFSLLTKSRASSINTTKTTEEFHSKNSNWLNTPRKHDIGSCKIQSAHRSRMNGHAVTAHQDNHKNKPVSTAEAKIAPNIGTEVNVRVQAKVPPRQVSTKKLLVSGTLHQKHQFSPILSQHHTIMPLSVEKSCFSGGREKLETEIGAKQSSMELFDSHGIALRSDQVISESVFREAGNNIQAIKTIMTQEKEERAPNCKAQRKGDTKISLKLKNANSRRPSSSNPSSHPSTSISPALRKSLTAPGFSSIPTILNSNPTRRDLTESGEPILVSNRHPTPKMASGDRQLNSSSLLKANSFPVMKTSDFGNNLGVPRTKEQRRPSISLSLILDSLSSTDSSCSENGEDYESDCDEVWEESIRHMTT
ncbi:cyclic nucleotide-gated cation channel [Elysia marginata]|uniref:Cyclic nucleotide-gated cation channel n=1 Tax=Elysia marginata TaxID=1093978 RepID=A0AAV4FVU9_9GAST|nr:cyclic nucleotide-gated cation channel [Elysia marginata]